MMVCLSHLCESSWLLFVVGSRLLTVQSLVEGHRVLLSDCSQAPQTNGDLYHRIWQDEGYQGRLASLI